MNDESIRVRVTKDMLESGIVEGTDGHMYVYKDGHQYMILLTIVDITNFSGREIDDE